METKHHNHQPNSDPIAVVAQRIGEVLVGRALTTQELDQVCQETLATLRQMSQSERTRIAGLLGNGNSQKTKLTPPELARLWGISPDKVLAWIRSGELRAVNVATDRNSRPRYVIDEKDLAAFEERRANGANRTQPRTKRRRSSPKVIQFY